MGRDLKRLWLTNRLVKSDIMFFNLFEFRNIMFIFCEFEII